MCGIAGGVGPSAPTKQLLNSQLKSIEHRGPDDQGTFLGNNVSLGMCRLAIIEIEAGVQPAMNRLGNIHLVWNGEIYNYKELKVELEQVGVHCRDSSESEILLNLYMVHGINFVKKLNGMFAIAIYDNRSDSLHLIRDRIGKKPLWFSKANDGTLFFASEVRAICLAVPNRTLRPEMVSEVMQYGYINSPNSSFEEINQLPPGTILTWHHGKLVSTRYWQLDFERKIKLHYNEALEVTKEKIEKAVSLRLISERPLGSFLSGGIDSTIVTSYMAKLMKEKVKTYSIGFEDSRFNEAHHAREVANFLKTDHHEVIVKPDPNLIVEEIAKTLDQPFADSSIIPSYLLAKFARQDLVVALGGDGGDEVFSGYDRYLAAPIMQKVNLLMVPLSIGSKVAQLFSQTDSRKVRRVQSQLLFRRSLGSRYNAIVSLSQLDDLKKIINPDFFSASEEIIRISEFENDKISSLNRMTRTDLGSYLPGDLLVKADLATMANSLELRSPLLDVNVVEWGISLPDIYKIKRAETKHILKDVARSLVPAELITRPKMGFGIPRADWMRNEMRDLVSDLLLDSTAKQRSWFDSKSVVKIVKEHMSGKDRDGILWPMLMLELWARTWLD